jgi:hypothetical protein
MRNYRNLFEQEFGGNPRLLDISGPGLPLGVKTVSTSEACAILNGSQEKAGSAGRPVKKAQFTDSAASSAREKIAAFVHRELETLTTLRETLSGERTLEKALLEELLDAADYLWAHFPECAGAGGRRPAVTDLSFLKRVRTEIEPFHKAWEMTLGEL